MARGKIQIKRIENTTNRQVTYSKRRNGLFKKANELTVLCDAKVSLIMFSSTGKLHEYISPSTSTKQIFDLYQKALGFDLWSTQYERMQQTMKELKEVNRDLRKQIRNRMGECLDDLSFADLSCLEQEMDEAVTLIRNRKTKSISSQIDTTKKKVRNAEHVNRNLVRELEATEEDPYYGLVDNGGDYGFLLGYQHGGPRIYALRQQPNQHSNNLHSGVVSDLTTYHLLE